MIRALLAVAILCASSPLFGQNRITLRGFPDGLNLQMSPNQIKNTQVSAADDVLFDEKPGSVVTRGGFTLVSSTDTTEAMEYKKRNGQTFLIRHYQGTLYSSADFGKTWTELISGLKWELNPTRMIVFDDYCVITNGIDDVIIFDGVIVAQYDFIPRGKFPIVHHHRLFMANTWKDADRIAFNVISEDITTKEAWPDDYNEPVDGSITGVGAFMDQLVIFTDVTTWAILGTNPFTWRVSQRNSNYGCIQHETIAMDKGLLMFLSREGVKGYNGSQIVPLDHLVRDFILDSNNMTGAYSYLIYNNTRDFKIDSSTGIDTSLNEIKLKEFSVSWEEDDLNATLSSTTYIDDTVRLSTTSAVTMSTYTRSGEFNEWTSDTGYEGTYFFDDGKIETSAIVEDDTWMVNVTGFGTTPSTALKLSQIQFKANFQLTTYHNMLVEGNNSWTRGTAEENATGQLKVSAVQSWIDADVYVLYVGDDTKTKVLTNYRCSTVQSEPCIGTYESDAKDGSSFVYFYRYENTTTQRETKTINFPIPPDATGRKVSAINIHFKLGGRKQYNTSDDWFVGTSLRQFNSVETALSRHRYRLYSVSEIFMNNATTDATYLSTGTVTLASKKIDEDNTATASLSTMTVYGHWDSSLTNIAFETRTSTDDATWEAWTAVVLDTTSMDLGGYAYGPITSSPGNYIEVRATLTSSTNTIFPYISAVYVDAIQSTGSIKLSYAQISQNDGGWSYSIIRDNGEQTRLYYVGFGTSSNITISTTAFVSGDILPGTTNQLYVQHRIDLTTDGTSNPTVSSITDMYIPVSAPIWASAISFGDRYHIALSSVGTENTTVMVYDRNNAWTSFDIPVTRFMKVGNDCYFSNPTGIYKLYDGTTDAGVAIDASFEKVIVADFSYDHRLKEIVTIGQEKTAGTLSATFKSENSTPTYTATNIDLGTDGNRFRHRQPSGGSLSGVHDWTIGYRSLSPFEINVIEIFPEIEKQLRK